MIKFITFLCILLLIRIILFQFFPPKTETITKNPISETSIFTQIKGHIKDSYSKHLPAQDAALLMGIVFGDKDLDHDSMKQFQATGVLHIIAASGMNVSMLIEFVLVFLLLFFKRPYALIITAGIVIFYTALGEFQASIVRASIMGIIALGAGVTGRQNTSFLALFYAAWAMIFWDPAVISSISFILSFSATLGIIILDPIFKQFVFRGSLFEDFRTTLSAQIATTPILLFFFGTYSAVSIVTNFLVLWTVPLLMVFGMAAAILSFISDMLAAPVIYICLPLLSYFWIVIEFFSKLAHPIEIKDIPWTIVIGYYLLLGAGIVWIKKRLATSH